MKRGREEGERREKIPTLYKKYRQTISFRRMYSIIGILFVEQISKNTIKIHSNHFWRWSTCTYSFVTSLFRVNSFENSKGSFHRFYNHNNFIFKHGSIQYEREFLILITGWPSKKIFFERKGLIPRSDPLCPGQWWIEINFNNKWAANRTDRLLRVNSRLEIKKKEKKKREYDPNVFVISPRIETISHENRIYFASFVDRWRGTKPPLLKATLTYGVVSVIFREKCASFRAVDPRNTGVSPPIGAVLAFSQTRLHKSANNRSLYSDQPLESWALTLWKSN